MPKQNLSGTVTIQQAGEMLHIEIRGRNRWAAFIPLAAVLGLLILLALALLLGALFVLGTAIAELVAGHASLTFWLLLPALLVALAGAGLAALLQWPLVLGYAPRRETLALDDRGLTIQRSGPLATRRFIPMEHILGICQSGVYLRGFLSGTTLMTHYFRYGLWVWRTGNWAFLPLTICSGLAPQDAEAVLVAIRKRQPRLA